MKLALVDENHPLSDDDKCWFIHDRRKNKATSNGQQWRTIEDGGYTIYSLANPMK